MVAELRPGAEVNPDEKRRVKELLDKEREAYRSATGDLDIDPWEPSPDIELRDCGQCGHLRLCRREIDPLIWEVDGEVTDPDWWCGTCWHGRKDDV